MNEEEIEARIAQIEARITAKFKAVQAELEQENADLKEQLREVENQISAELEKENAALREELRSAQSRIRRAKNIEPVQKPGFKRVLHLVLEACLSIEKLKSGWLLKLGHKVRFFRKLSAIWELLISDEWNLEDIFPTSTNSDKLRQQSWWDKRPRLRPRNPSIAPGPSWGPVIGEVRLQEFLPITD